MNKFVLVVNPGSTSTKVACFDDGQVIAEENIHHSANNLKPFQEIIQQQKFRTDQVKKFMKSHNIKGADLSAVVGRGGLLKPIPGGTYKVDETMLEDVITERYGSHASNLGAIIAYDLAQKYGVEAFVVDPVIVDELNDYARLSGFKPIERRSVGHILNQKAVARIASEELTQSYEETNLIVAHIGGGMSVGAHKNGRVTDLMNALDGEGGFTPERSGGLPLVQFAEYILEHNLSLKEVRKLVAGQSGLYSYLQETDVREIERWIESGDEKAAFYIDGMAYHMAKDIGEMAVVLSGKVDVIVLTGGLSHSKRLTRKLIEMTEWIAPVKVYEGEMEMEALYEGARRVLSGKEIALNYAKTSLDRVSNMK